MSGFQTFAGMSDLLTEILYVLAQTLVTTKFLQEWNSPKSRSPSTNRTLENLSGANLKTDAGHSQHVAGQTCASCPIHEILGFDPSRFLF